MAILVEYIKDCGISVRCKGLTTLQIDEFLDLYESELVEKYGYDIDTLADIAYGRMPDLTKKADYEVPEI